MTFLGLHADWIAPQFSNLWSGHGGSPLGPTQCNRLPCFHASYPCPGETLLCVFKYYPRSLFMPGKNCIHMGHLLIPQNIRCFMFAFSLIPARVLVRIGSISDKIPGFRQHTTSPRTGRQAQQKLGGFAGPWWPEGSCCTFSGGQALFPVLRRCSGWLQAWLHRREGGEN